MLIRLFLFSLLYLGCACILYHCCTHSGLSPKQCFYLELCILFLSVYLSLYLSVLTPNGDSVYLITVLKNLTENRYSAFMTALASPIRRCLTISTSFSESCLNCSASHLTGNTALLSSV